MEQIGLNQNVFYNSGVSNVKKVTSLQAYKALQMQTTIFWHHYQSIFQVSTSKIGTYYTSGLKR